MTSTSFRNAGSTVDKPVVSEGAMNTTVGDILVVDDEIDNLQLLTQLLSQDGYQVRPTETQQQAIEAALAQPPCIILLGVGKPEIDGIKFCERLKQDERTRDIPIIITSALQDAQSRIRGFEAGGVDFISKPYQEQEVLARVRTHMSLHQAQSHLKDLVAKGIAELEIGDERFQLLVDQAGDAFFILDYEGEIRDVNQRACLSLGRSREELLGLSIAEVDVDVDPKKHIGEFWDPLEPGEHVTFEGRHRRKDGSTFPVEVRLGRLDLPTEKLLLALARDITERKHKEKEIERHRELERLVAKISIKIVGQTGLELENSIQAALSEIGNFFDVDAVRLYRLSPDGDVLKFRLNWLSDRLAPPQEMEMILGGTYPNIASHFMNGDPMAFGSLNECPQIPELLRILEFFGTKAGVGVPLEIDDSGVDVFAMDQVLTVHEWPEDIVERCKTIGQVLLSAVRRREVELDLEARYQDIKKLKKRLERENIYLMEEIDIQHENDDIVGKSHLIRSVLSQAKRVAVQDTAVLVLGETGTGKGLIARDIHQKSRRRNRALITVNCAALPATLIESELFGHEKGAFTGALNQKLGRFELADGGTMFLDEVGDLPLELQAKLLRVLEDQEFERLGSSKTKTVDVRIIAASNRHLDQLIEEGKFRADLFYRLGVFPIHVPGLAERRSDIPLLVWFFISELQHKLGKTITEISSESMDTLISYDWPGNVRELRNIIERAMILSPTSVLELGDWFPGSPVSTSITSQIRKATGETLDEVQRAYILEVLQACDWKIHGENGAAERLGLKRTTLQSRMKKLGIERPVS
jgi:formate hydrogenlyase transcriptional activator